MLGRELQAAFDAGSARPRLELHCLGHGDIDLEDDGRVVEVLSSVSPDIVINAAAYTDVDGCETDEVKATEVNGHGAGRLASWCHGHHARLVHVSTDFVFDGSKTEPYLPDDPINPINAYGRGKADGEKRVRAELQDHVIVRTSWLFSEYGKNFVKSILRLADERDELRVVTDQIGSPTYARDLASSLLVLGCGEFIGTYHFCNGGSCSWFEFAKEIVRLAGKSVDVLQTTAAEFNRAADRPAYSVLDTQKLQDDTGIHPRPWQEALADCIDRMK
jgi:dTDP-4-dehydrorhamnose reductase